MSFVSHSEEMVHEKNVRRKKSSIERKGTIQPSQVSFQLTINVLEIILRKTIMSLK